MLSFFRLPFFVAVVSLMYWSLQLGGLFYRLRFFHFTGGRSDCFEWANFCRKLFRVRMFRIGERKLYRDGKCMYLCNHRCWADFFIDMCATEGTAAPLSRYMVLVVFPMFMVYAQIFGCMLIFNRTAIKDKEKFNKWLDQRMNGSRVQGLMVYPEGHRNVKPESLPLRRGMLKYAFSRKLPLQIIMSSHKEHVLSEKQLRVGFGQKVITGYSDVIQSEGFADFETFFHKVKVEWDKSWTEVFSAKEEDAEEMLFTDVPRFDLPFTVRLSLAAVMVFTILTMLGTFYLILKTLTAFASFLL